MDNKSTSTSLTTDKTDKVYETSDYKIFKSLPGNRIKGTGHVNQLRLHMENTGNLTNHFPIVVNEKMQVIDGQHRLEALKQLKWSVCYRIQEGLTIDTVRQINAAQKNWSYMDYATSYADLGNSEYKWFIKLSEQFGFGYSIIAAYSGITGVMRGTSGSITRHYHLFKQGEFKPTYAKDVIEVYLEQYKEVSEATKHHNRAFALAMLKIMRVPEYDQDRMLNKIKVMNKELTAFANITDYLRQIEDIYNYKAMPVAIARLF